MLLLFFRICGTCVWNSCCWFYSFSYCFRCVCCYYYCWWCVCVYFFSSSCCCCFTLQLHRGRHRLCDFLLKAVEAIRTIWANWYATTRIFAFQSVECATFGWICYRSHVFHHQTQQSNGTLIDIYIYIIHSRTIQIWFISCARSERNSIQSIE